MNEPPSRSACAVCGRDVERTARGAARAHQCPHGLWCVPTAHAKRRGIRGGACFHARQLSLFRSGGGQ